MRVLLNCESLRPPLTGIGNYTTQLLRRLRMHPEVDSVLCHRDGGFSQGNEPPQTGGPVDGRGSRSGAFVGAIKVAVRAVPGAYELRAWMRDRQFKRDAQRAGASVYHEPNYILKPFAGPSVATIHDLSHIRYPQYHPRERVAFLQRNLPKTIARADRIITVSQFVRQELVELMGVEPGRVVAIPLAAGPEFRPRTADETVAVLARLGLSRGRYLLSVATFEPRKNLAGLLRAYRMLDEKLRRAFPLVLAGAPGWRSGELTGEIDRAVSTGDVRLLGYLPAEELVQVYAGAAGFAYVSHYEGFGLPLLEAMASAVPVLTSNRASMPEVAADAALYADPDSIEQIRDGLRELLHSPGSSAMLGVKGVTRAASFSWERCADRTVDVYRQAIDAFPARHG